MAFANCGLARALDCVVGLQIELGLLSVPHGLICAARAIATGRFEFWLQTSPVSSSMVFMPDTPKSFSDAILAVLRLAREAGQQKLGRTALTKFIYLLDLYAAEEREGVIFTGAPWKFWNFGPYAETLDKQIDTLAESGQIQAEIRDGAERDYTLFFLGEWSTAKTLEALGLPPGVSSRLLASIKEYQFDLPGLLNHVYFETLPMQGVRPGDVIDFSKARKLNWQRDVKPYKFGVADRAKAKRIKELAARLGAGRRDCKFVLPEPPVYDELYAHASTDADMELAEGPHSVKLDFSDMWQN